MSDVAASAPAFICTALPLPERSTHVASPLLRTSCTVLHVRKQTRTAAESKTVSHGTHTMHQQMCIPSLFQTPPVPRGL
jgi:hypothetical protein